MPPFTTHSRLGFGDGGWPQAIDQRYLQICEIARTRAVISLGISCFIEVPGSSGKGAAASYEVCTFNLATLPTTNYVCEPSAAVFLADHGFDFNSQIRHGLRYTPGLCDAGRAPKAPKTDGEGESVGGRSAPTTGKGSAKGAAKSKGGGKGRQKDGDVDGGAASGHTTGKESEKVERQRETPHPLADIFAAILQRRLILHNGFFDLCFLYQAFYAPLPSKLDVFTSDLAEMTSVHKVFDTKYASERGETEFSATFLEYLFRKLERTHRGTTGHLEFPRLVDDADLGGAQAAVASAEEGSSSGDVLVPAGEGDAGPVELCKSFKAHGACRRGAACPHSHSIDDILDAEESKGRKRKRVGVDSDTASTAVSDTPRSSKRQAVQAARSQGHRAGFDAYMTGFCYAAFRAHLGGPTVEGLTQRIHLSNAKNPLLLQRSQFAQTSADHKDNMARRCKSE